MSLPNPVVAADMNSPVAVSGAGLAPALLRIFISYASEDIRVATAIYKCLRSALGDFAQINMDRSFIDAGQEFRGQITTRLEQSHVFISLYLGLDKQWPAWEIGYFERLMNEGNEKRDLVSFFLDRPPVSIAQYGGVDLGILPAHLQSSLADFTRIVASIDQTHPICRFVTRQREAADGYRAKAGLPALQRDPEREVVPCVQRMMLEIFDHLRTTVEATFKPQKQILIRTTDVALAQSETELPLEACLIPVGLGDPMSIFGLSANERTWEEFLTDAQNDEHLDSWRAAIVSVVTSSLDNSINVDNSQIIMSVNADTAYRVILTSANKYYDGKREFNVYFVEMLKREDFGDHKTTLLLKALDIVCRFRFMFIEKGTPFSSIAIQISSPQSVIKAAAKLIKELNLLRKDSRDAGLDSAAVWLTMVNDEAFRDIVEIFQPLETKIRQIAGRVLEARSTPTAIPALQKELSVALKELAERAEPGNARLIREMTVELGKAALHERGSSSQTITA